MQKKEEAIIAIDKLDKIGVEGVTKELQERGYSASEIKKIFTFISGDKTLSQLKKQLSTEEAINGIAELEELFGYLQTLGVTSAQFDVSLARGLAYYTGTVYEVFATKGSILSSLGSGGRYDTMIGGYTENARQVPAVGISVGIVPIMETLKQQQQVKRTLAKILVIPINAVSEALLIAQQLRTAGINTDFSLGKKGVSKSLQYADALGIPYVLILGEEELKKKKVLLRDMQSGQEQLLTVAQVIKKLGS